MINSLATRLMVVLTVTIVVAAILSFLVADRARVHDFEEQQLQLVAVSAADIAERLMYNQTKTETQLANNLIMGVRFAPADFQRGTDVPALSALLQARLGAGAQPSAQKVPREACFGRINIERRAAGIKASALPDCWIVGFVDFNGAQRYLAIDQQPLQLPPNSTLEPLFLLSVIILSASLSFMVIYFAVRPLSELSRAARVFSVTTDPELLPEVGPNEIRSVIQTFNLMQVRVRKGFRDRTQLLASIAHDLQTPLTRLRLLLEHVAEDSLRTRLVGEVSSMSALVRVGLDLARSAETREEWSTVDLDSLLSSVAEDAAEFGHNVQFTGGVGAEVRVKLNALQRCVNNLVDNAIKYGGDAVLSCRKEGLDLVIEVRDHGPGITPALIEQALQPFTAQAVGGGTGIGLAIVQSLASSFGASLQLNNHSQGGLVAQLRLSKYSA